MLVVAPINLIPSIPFIGVKMQQPSFVVQYSSGLLKTF